MATAVCDLCSKEAGSLFLDGELWICRHCRKGDGDPNVYIKEMGIENPLDPKGSTAHVRDIKDRRWHPTEKRMFYKSKELPERRYFFPKG